MVAVSFFLCLIQTVAFTFGHVLVSFNAHKYLKAKNFRQALVILKCSVVYNVLCDTFVLLFQPRTGLCRFKPTRCFESNSPCLG